MPSPGIGVVPAPVRVRRKISIGMLTAFVLWLTVVCGGTIQMIRYSTAPGSSGQPPSAWPTESQIPFDAHRPTLIMFAHPHCPCTRASLGELEVLLTRFPGQLSSYVVFLKPTDTITNWEKTDLWRKASSIPGVRVYTDNSGSKLTASNLKLQGKRCFMTEADTCYFKEALLWPGATLEITPAAVLCRNY